MTFLLVLASVQLLCYSLLLSFVGGLGFRDMWG